MDSTITEEMRRRYEEHLKKYPPLTDEELEEAEMTMSEWERCMNHDLMERYHSRIIEKLLSDEYDPRTLRKIDPKDKKDEG